MSAAIFVQYSFSFVFVVRFTLPSGSHISLFQRLEIKICFYIEKNIAKTSAIQRLKDENKMEKKRIHKFNVLNRPIYITLCYIYVIDGQLVWIETKI